MRDPRPLSFLGPPQATTKGLALEWSPKRPTPAGVGRAPAFAAPRWRTQPAGTRRLALEPAEPSRPSGERWRAPCAELERSAAARRDGPPHE